MIKTQVYITEQDGEQLSTIAKRTGRKKSEIVREAVHEYCEHHNSTGFQHSLDAAFGMLREAPVDPDELRRATREGFDHA
jgi:hypothetical protein